MRHIVKKGIPTQDGAGVKLTRVFSIRETSLTDPFLMMDHLDTERDYFLTADEAKDYGIIDQVIHKRP